MNANCTRISGRTSAFAPTSSSVTGRPGTGSVSASAGRWMPGARRMCSWPAASAAPVEPLQTSACARPSATARAACTIEASGVPRTARTGSGSLAIETGRVDDLDAVAGGRRAAPAGPNSSTSTPCAAAMRAPAATSAGPRSAPLASTAMTVTAQAPSSGRDRGRARAERRPRGRRRCRTPGTRGAGGAGCGSAGSVERRGDDLVLRAPLRGAAVRLLLLGSLHAARQAVAARPGAAAVEPTRPTRASARGASPSAGRAVALVVVARGRASRERGSRRPGTARRSRACRAPASGAASATASCTQRRRSSTSPVDVRALELLAAAGHVDLARVDLDRRRGRLEAAHAGPGERRDARRSRSA